MILSMSMIHILGTKQKTLNYDGGVYPWHQITISMSMICILGNKKKTLNYDDDDGERKRRDI